ncbi:MAG TPA: HlyD family efflux transporter periplasmic adaptor subunit [bacterium]|nr:HlyD family efflux transporter periplasmic adaptor subunit [bacterium]
MRCFACFIWKSEIQSSIKQKPMIKGILMKSKLSAWLLASGIVVFGILVSGVLSRQKDPMQRRPQGGGQKPIRLLTVENRSVSKDIMLSGPLTAYDRIELYAEVQGVLMENARRFREGVRYSAGDTLLLIDDRVYRNNVLAQKSGLMNQITLLLPDLSIDFSESAGHWEDYLRQFDLYKPMKPLPLPGSDQERYYVAARNIYHQYYSVKSMEETLKKYTLLAPFDGVVTQANINPGTLVRAGQKIGELTNTGVLEMKAAVGIRDADRLRVNQPVTLISEVLNGTFEGRIVRISPVIDRSSMSMTVFIQTRDPRLMDGMYLTALLKGAPVSDVFVIPRDLLVNRDMVYAVRDSVLMLKRIAVADEDGDRVMVRGLEDGTRILGEPWAEAKEGVRLPAGSGTPPSGMGRNGS